VNVAIVGCGLIGRKRAAALAGCRLRICADVVPERAAALAATVPYTEALNDWRTAVTRPDVDIVVVATTHDRLAEIAAAAANAGKHVLIEKPGARRAAELDAVRVAAQRTNVRVRVGFNHRFHPALLKAQQLVREGVTGPLLFVRGRYGHGGRPGYEQEWRMRPELSGGGELLDQGTHLIDLARLFLGEFAHASGCLPRYFWNAPVEDNAFLVLRTASEQVAFLHASWTEWKNLFSLEICGRDAKLDIAGLGGSYGVECLTLYHMRPDMGPPDTTSWEWPMGDRSWDLEFEALLEDIELGREPVPGVADAQAVLHVVETVYEGAQR
jgi:predicted dehydrogenase